MANIAGGYQMNKELGQRVASRDEWGTLTDENNEAHGHRVDQQHTDPTHPGQKRAPTKRKKKRSPKKNAASTESTSEHNGSQTSGQNSSDGGSKNAKQRHRRTKWYSASPSRPAEEEGNDNGDDNATVVASPCRRRAVSEPDADTHFDEFLTILRRQAEIVQSTSISHFPHIYAEYAQRSAAAGVAEGPEQQHSSQSTWDSRQGKANGDPKRQDFRPRQHFESPLVLTFCCGKLYYVSTKEFTQHRRSTLDHDARFEQQGSTARLTCCSRDVGTIGGFRRHMRHLHSHSMHHWQQEVAMFRRIRAFLLRTCGGDSGGGTGGGCGQTVSDELDDPVPCCGAVFTNVEHLETHLDNAHSPPDWFLAPGKKEVLGQARCMFEQYLAGVRSMLPAHLWHQPIAYSCAVNAARQAQNAVIQQWNEKATVEERRAFDRELAAWRVDQMGQPWYWAHPRAHSRAQSGRGGSSDNGFFQYDGNPGGSMLPVQQQPAAHHPGAFVSQLPDGLNKLLPACACRDQTVIASGEYSDPSQLNPSRFTSRSSQHSNQTASRGGPQTPRAASSGTSSDPPSSPSSRIQLSPTAREFVPGVVKRASARSVQKT